MTALEPTIPQAVPLRERADRLQKAFANNGDTIRLKLTGLATGSLPAPLKFVPGIDKAPQAMLEANSKLFVSVDLLMDLIGDMAGTMESQSRAIDYLAKQVGDQKAVIDDMQEAATDE